MDVLWFLKGAGVGGGVAGFEVFVFVAACDGG
jgi:hypothetical protein